MNKNDGFHVGCKHSLATEFLLTVVFNPFTDPVIVYTEHSLLRQQYLSLTGRQDWNEAGRGSQHIDSPQGVGRG